MGASSDVAGAVPRRRVIGVTGGSGAGKSLFAGALAARLQPRSVVLLSEDDYYRAIHEPDFDPRRFDFDAPSARDHAQLAEHLRRLRQGRSIQRPVYSFRIHAPLKRRVATGPAEVVIVEGLHLLHSDEVRAQLDFSIFLDVDDDVRFRRRLSRDTRERGRSVESVTAQYAATVRPAHDRFVSPAKDLADLVLSFRSADGMEERDILTRWINDAAAALANHLGLFDQR